MRGKGQEVDQMGWGREREAGKAGRGGNQGHRRKKSHRQCTTAPPATLGILLFPPHSVSCFYR